MGYLLLLFGGVFVFVGAFMWDSVVDGTLRRAPSDWLGYGYLSVIVMLLGYGSKYLDEFRVHPYRASFIVVVAALSLGWSAVIMWRAAARWDKKFNSKSHRKFSRH
jgi:hypothetical protein